MGAVTFNKRGVQIPVMMVVILIIAIITLGLIIGFIRFFFGETQDLVKRQLDQVKQDLRSDLEEGRELLATSFGRKMEVKQGEELDIAFAIKNNVANAFGDDSVCYRAGVKCVRPFDLGPDASCTRTPGEENVFVGGINTETGDVVFANQWVTQIEQGGLIDVLNNDVLVGEITFQVPVTPGAYSMQLIVERSEDREACAAARNSPNWEAFEIHQFTAEVS